MSIEKDFILIIKHHTGIINSICNTYFPKPDDFKDARQDVILQLWRSFPTFRGASKVSTWIYKVALNTVMPLCLGKANTGNSGAKSHNITTANYDMVTLGGLMFGCN
ncbi:hypothetical protein GVN16_10035 [Emticicia sp. CRIBPO]|uniref:RNA polymerase sigma factor n=1 Tax=Emticicia sp. CRIBPO TaxID=2683258 RepID=UPI00141229B3|nr:sigma-70 family RNA polymerase sigma factor [Emticicia sp. CRIBPO]NBA86100.1 hypothetical protein [Emticicia sp. CRIBPO]